MSESQTLSEHKKSYPDMWKHIDIAISKGITENHIIVIKGEKFYIQSKDELSKLFLKNVAKKIKTSLDTKSSLKFVIVDGRSYNLF